MSYAYMPCKKCNRDHEVRGSDDGPLCYSLPMTTQDVEPPELGFDALMDATTVGADE